MDHRSPASGQWRGDYSKECTHKHQGASKVQPITLVVEPEFGDPTKSLSGSQEWIMATKLRETQRRQSKTLVVPIPCSKIKVESHLEKLMEQFQSPSCQEPGECSFVYYWGKRSKVLHQNKWKERLTDHFNISCWSNWEARSLTLPLMLIFFILVLIS